MKKRVDVIDLVEKMVGKRHEEWSETEQLMALMMQKEENKRMEKEMKVLNDTHNQMSWDEFKFLMTSKGFEIVLSEKFLPDQREHMEKEITFKKYQNLINEFNQISEIETGKEKMDEIESFLSSKYKEMDDKNHFSLRNIIGMLMGDINHAMEKMYLENIFFIVDTTMECEEKYLGKNREEEICVFANREKGYLTSATSYHGYEKVGVNGGHFYCQGMPKPEFMTQDGGIVKGFLYYLDGDSSWKDGIRVCGTDIREGLFQYITEIEKHLNTLPIWHDQTSHIWVINYEEERESHLSPFKGERGFFDRKNIERITRCPEWVQTMVGLQARKNQYKKWYEKK